MSPDSCVALSRGTMGLSAVCDGGILLIILTTFGIYFKTHWRQCVVSLIKTLYLEVIKLEFILKLKIKRNDWLFADTCPQATNHCSLI